MNAKVIMEIGQKNIYCVQVRTRLVNTNVELMDAGKERESYVFTLYLDAQITKATIRPILLDARPDKKPKCKLVKIKL